MDLAFEEFKTEDGTITQAESKNQKLKRVTNCVQKNKQKTLCFLQNTDFQNVGYRSNASKWGKKKILKTSVSECKPN